MARIPLDIAPGLMGDDTTFSAQGRWADASCVRFRLGRPETIGGWESLVTTLLTGVCRTVFPFTDNSGTLNVGFGTHSNLQLYQGGALYDITPTLALPPIVLTNALSVTNGSPTVTVTQNGHGLTTSDTVTISGASAIGGITPNGTFAVASVVDANTWTYTFTSNATGTVSGAGGSPTIAPQRAYAAAQIDGTGTSGYGTGAYGVGGYGLPSTADYFPRTWSLAAWGQNLLACPRNGTIYAWTNNTAQVAQPLLNAPARVQYMLVAPNDGGFEAFAIGCNEEVSGVFNPMVIRHSAIRDDTTWNTSNTTTAREYTLTGGGRLVAGRMCGPYLLVWSDRALYLGEFQGALDAPWVFSEVATNCGLIGPNAAVVHGQTAYWISPDRQFYSYSLGGQPQPIDCPVRDDFAENLAASQGDKIVASTCAEFSEVRFDYPDQRDGSGYENSRYLVLTIAGEDAGAWSRGIMSRTAYVDAGAAQYPIACTYAGNVYFHERGQSADGAPFSWFIETADCYLDENVVMNCRGIWPDIFHQVGPVYVNVTSRFYPQDTEASSGDLTMTVASPKVDLRQTGRLFRFKFWGNSAPTYARLGKFDVDVVKGGLR